MEQNIVEDLVIPEVPKVIPNQEMYVYVPVATYKSKGIANFDSVTLNISNGTVSVKTLFVDGMIDNRIVQVTGQNSDKVISQKAITDLLEEKASKNEISEIAKETAKAYTDNNTAFSLEFSVDNSTFILTATLKNANGEILGTPQTVDLPLESVVVNGAYDSGTKSIILTLQSGNTVDIPVADLIDGLATTADLAKKLDIIVSTSQYAQVYAKNTDGTQMMKDMSSNAVENTIIIRDASGVAKVSDPKEGKDIANKDYVDNKETDVISQQMARLLF